MRQVLAVMVTIAGIVVLAYGSAVLAEVLLEDSFADLEFTRETWGVLVSDPTWTLSYEIDLSTQSTVGNGVLTIGNVGTNTGQFMLQSKKDFMDFVVELRIRILRFGQSGHAGVRLRVAESGRQYMYFIKEGEHGLRFWDPVIGEIGFPGGEDLPKFEPGKWYVLRIELRGSEARGYVDGKFISRVWPMEQMTGKIALYAASCDIEVHYIRVTSASLSSDDK